MKSAAELLKELRACRRNWAPERDGGYCIVVPWVLAHEIACALQAMRGAAWIGAPAPVKGIGTPPAIPSEPVTRVRRKTVVRKAKGKR